MTLSEVESRCENVKAKSFTKGPGFVAKCPVCDSKSQHLSVCDKGDGFWHVNCIRGHSEEEILAGLGCTQEDRRLEPREYQGRSDRPAETTYVYHDLTGDPIFRKVRFYVWKEEKDGKPAGWSKCFKQEGMNGESTLAHLNGKSKSLYRLPEVVAAVRSGQTVYVNEGEKAVEAFRTAGQVATCQPGGALGKSPDKKWLPEHTEMLRGAKHVVVVADRDETGELYAQYVAAQLAKAVGKVEVVQAAVESDKADAYDHLRAGKGLESFIPRKDLEPPRISSHIKRYRASDIEPKEVPWLLYPYIAKGVLFGIEGDPGVGKSYICAALATAVSLGVRLPFFEDAFPQGRVLMLATEDSKEFTTVPRLVRFGADLDKIEIIEDVWALDRDGLRVLDDIIADFQPTLVFIDPITAFIDAATKGVARPSIDVHGIMTGLKEIANRHQCAIGCLRHLRKSSGSDVNPLYAGIGDISIVGKYRTVLQIRKDHEDSEKPKRCIVTHPKSNIGPTGDSFAYRVVPVGRDRADFTWLGMVDVSADDMANGQAQKKDSRAIAQAKQFLIESLTGVLRISEDFLEEAKKNGISRSSIDRAKQTLDVQIVRRGFADGKVRWTIPAAKKHDPFADEEEDEYAA